MQINEDENQIVVNLDNSFHPYKTNNLSETQPDVPTLNQREPFNDAIRHGDIIAGYQQNRTLSDYPKRLRPLVRLYAILTLILIAGAVVWRLVR